MLGLHGDFSTMPLKDLVVYLGEKAASGTLKLTRDDVRKQLVLQQGQVINASSNLPREYLGQFLINLGYITEEQFNAAYETQLQTRVFMGRILVMIGLVSEEVVSAVLSTKFRETVLEAYTWTTGNFTFDPSSVPAQPEGVMVKVPLRHIEREFAFREQAWGEFRRAFPSRACTLELVRENLVEQPRPGSLDEKLVKGIEAGQTLDELMLAMHATDFFFFQRLFSLQRLGAVRVLPPSSPPVTEAVGPPQPQNLRGRSTEELLSQASYCLAQGEYRCAWAHAAAAHAARPDAGHDQLLQRIEVAWYEYLKAELLSRERVPKALLAPDEVRALPLSAAERYLLSRVDGQKALANIIRIAPLREFESLAIFDRFVGAGWVRFD